MIYKATSTLNFAQGEFLMIGTYAAFSFYVPLDLIMQLLSPLQR